MIRILGPASVLLSLIAVGLIGTAAPTEEKIKLHLRSAVEPFKGTDSFDEIALTREIVPIETALILCDVWDKHWCDSATTRS